jgi:hypothetical protein
MGVAHYVFYVDASYVNVIETHHFISFIGNVGEAFTVEKLVKVVESAHIPGIEVSRHNARPFERDFVKPRTQCFLPHRCCDKIKCMTVENGELLW